MSPYPRPLSPRAHATPTLSPHPGRPVPTCPHLGTGTRVWAVCWQVPRGSWPSGLPSWGGMYPSCTLVPPPPPFFLTTAAQTGVPAGQFPPNKPLNLELREMGQAMKAAKLSPLSPCLRVSGLPSWGLSSMSRGLALCLCGPVLMGRAPALRTDH